MQIEKENLIRDIVDHHIRQFVDVMETRYRLEVNDPLGVINAKKNNAFISQLGEEFMFYSAFVRSFDSSFGKVLENMGNAIATISYSVRGRIESYLLPQQTQHIDYLMTAYEKRDARPSTTDYMNFNCLIPSNLTSFLTSHETDNYFYDEEKGCHYLIELKAGGDLDNKKAKSEKIALLNEFFILKNSLQNAETVRIYFATAYNKFGEDVPWRQERVQTFFAEEELLIGKAYWNFVCNDPEGYQVIFDQYRISAEYMKTALERIKYLYFHIDKPIENQISLQEFMTLDIL
ncbi:MAG: MjaII restriction endonuclease [Herbinix sp.]|jgi:hypothetical protein|nr:MjaII restriction endonuclease [Herbinix sp.]